MPYLQVASVVRWRVNDLGKVVPGPAESKSVVVQDTGNPDSRIIATYIRDELEKLDWTKEQAKKLLNEAADGLLTVTGTNRFEVTAPPLPANYDAGPVATIVKALREAGVGQGGGGQQGQGGGGQQGQGGGGQQRQRGGGQQGQGGGGQQGQGGGGQQGQGGGGQ